MPNGIPLYSVVSTVKTGLFRVAGAGISGLLWDSSSSSQPASDAEDSNPLPDPESKLHTRHAFKDQSKSGSWIEISPDERYSAVIDDQNRVVLIDNRAGIVLQVWKGYHRPQVGWITTSWESRKGKCSKGKKYLVLRCTPFSDRHAIEILHFVCYSLIPRLYTTFL